MLNWAFRLASEDIFEDPEAAFQRGAATVRARARTSFTDRSILVLVDVHSVNFSVAKDETFSFVVQRTSNDETDEAEVRKLVIGLCRLVAFP